MKKVYLIAGSALVLIMIESFVLTRISHSNSKLAKKEILDHETAKNPSAQNMYSSGSRQPASDSKLKEENTQTTTLNEKTSNEFKVIEAKLKELKLCLSDQNCEYPQNDPRQYDIEVNLEIANELQKLKNLSNDPQLQMQILSIAAAELQSENGFVQQAALEILSLLPISQEAIHAIETGIDNSSNPRIIELTIEELKRYTKSEYQDQVANIISNMMTNTGVFAAKTASDSVFSFITDQNLQHFESVYQNLAKNTTVAKNLKTAIDEYKRLKSGG